MKRDYDTIVLGLGGIGAGAFYWLARRLGDDVLGIEQFALGHQRGGSQDHSRIVRYSYHHPAYVRLAARAYRTWKTLEEECGETLIHRCGGLDLFPEGGIIPASDYLDSLDECGIPYERLEAAEVRRRWPPFHLPDSDWGLFQADGGLVAAAKGNAAHLEGARRRGAAIRTDSPVTAARAVGDDEVEIEAGGEIFRCRRLVVAAGAWSNDLLAHFGLHLPLTVTREQVVYFAAPDLGPFAPERFPIWIWMDEPCFYGFPVFGEPGVKVAEDVGGEETTATTRSFEPDRAALARMRAWCQTYLPSALGPEHLIRTCLYTLTPDRDFVLDRLPDHPAVLVAIGAAHAFKFASALGEVLAELAIDGETEADLSLFAIDRPILQLEKPPTSYYV